MIVLGDHQEQRTVNQGRCQLMCTLILLNKETPLPDYPLLNPE
jgi:hypothetical protein